MFWTELGRRLQLGLKSFLLLLIGLYKAVAAVHLGGGCRFEPSCSCYAMEAAKTHPPLVASRLIVVRLLKCRPGGPWGYDPVPSKNRADAKDTFWRTT